MKRAEIVSYTKNRDTVKPPANVRARRSIGFGARLVPICPICGGPTIRTRDACLVCSHTTQVRE